MIKILTKRDLLIEALGVPDGITEAAIMIYDKVMYAIPNNYGFDDLNDINDKRIQINTDLQVSDYKFNNFSLQFNLIENDDDELRIISFGSGNPMKMTSNGYESMSILKNYGVGFALRIVLTAPRYITGGIIKQKLNSERESIIGVLAHEIMHTYNYYKNKKGNLPRELIYHLSTANNTGLRGVDNFFKCIYFGSLIETVVHASEIGSELKVRGIDRNNFLKFMLSHDTIVNLKFVSQYTFDKFITDLKSQIEDIKYSMQSANIPIPNNEDEIIFTFLRVYWKTLIDNGVEKIKDMVIDFNDINQLLYMNRFGKSMHEDTMKDVIRKVFMIRKEKNEESFKRFFEKEINYASFMAKKNLRKLFKLYAMAKNTDDKKLPSAMKRMTNESNKIFFENSRFFPKTDLKDLLKPNKNYGRKNDSFWKL
jgi:hypothetical protein